MRNRSSDMQCDVALRTSGASKQECLTIGYHLDVDQIPFTGDVRSLPGQAWEVSGMTGTAANNWKGSKSDISFTFYSTLATEQVLQVPHNVIAAPAFSREQATLVDSGTSISGANAPYFSSVT